MYVTEHRWQIAADVFLSSTTDGLRTQRTNGTKTYNYVYNGTKLSQMTVSGKTLNFTYDANGSPMTVEYLGATYYYVTNLQGDVDAILDGNGNYVVKYFYNAWGGLCSTVGSRASTLGVDNPLRYRAYVYDHETQLYYLQSRYYDPQLGRFINADAFASTGQGILGNNMFAYCMNNPVCRTDSSGSISYRVEENPEGPCLIVEESYYDLTGRYTTIVVFELSYVEEIAIYLSWIDIQMSSSGVDFALHNGNTLSLSYSNTSFEFDSFSVQFIENGSSSHSFVFSEDGWGIESDISVDGFNFSLTVQYMPNWVTTTIERIASDISSIGGFGDGVPRWKDSQTNAKLSYGGRVGCDLFNPTASMFR